MRLFSPCASDLAMHLTILLGINCKGSYLTFNRQEFYSYINMVVMG